MGQNEEIQQTQVKKSDDMDRVVVKPLSPREDLSKDENYGVYREFLKKGFETKGISNIAITGNFGIGKSSVLRTFSKEEGKKFLYLSLLEFRHNSGLEEYGQLSLWNIDNQEKETIYSLQQFECALLRQLIAKCRKKDIPLSSFQKVQEKNITKYRRIYAFVVAAYVLMITALIFKEQISDFFHLFLKDTNLHVIYLILFALVWIGGAFLVGWGIYHLLMHAKVKDISAVVSDSNVEVGATAVMTESCIEKNRFELIYILETLAEKYDAIVFEDMDRLKADICIDIFTHLREINQIVNERLQNKTICFLYVVNDSMMAKLNQTKFFDYIMPVIPTLGEANCRERVNGMLSEIGITGNHAVKLVGVLDEICELRDYRTIAHVQNEYYILEKLEVKKQNGVMLGIDNKSKLLAFVIYKVLLPDDYYLIREEKGILYQSFVTTEKTKESRYQFIYALQKVGYLTEECLKYIGYSKSEMMRIYHNILISDDLCAKQRILQDDKDGVCLEVFEWNKKSGNRCDAYVKGIQDRVMLYLVTRPNITEYEEVLAELVDCSCDMGGEFTSVDKTIQKIFPCIDISVQKMILRYFVQRKCTDFTWLELLIDERSIKEKCFAVLEQLEENDREYIVEILASVITRNNAGIQRYPMLSKCLQKVM